jgi:hypothetical protein
MRRAPSVGAPNVATHGDPKCSEGDVVTADGLCVLKDCTTGEIKMRYVGWGLLGLMAGVVIGRTAFKQQSPAISAAAGFAGGVAWAANETISKCGMYAHLEKT